ncbi:MAG TPA: efflux RND transporter periplasmic adaptor subunit, partial [Casimicrobiaceae bacterium]|nr:efflux RND transporter periplasmic adaptor subunit [Casimicrobiaceae bacterium]
LSRALGSLAACIAAATLVGCSKQASAPPPSPPSVLAMQVIQRDATVTGELVGRISAFREVALLPQVTGTVQKILFEPGQRVRENQLLFVIDPRPYQASLSEALGAVADAEASLARAKQDVARYEPLLPDNAIPRATYDTAVAAEKSAQAVVTQRRAAVDAARLDIAHTEVRSPVTGQIGLQQVEIGGLATGQTVLATVSTLDPVYVNFSIPEADYIRVMRRTGSREAAAAQARANAFQLTLPDGSTYEHPGSFDFVERAISAATGTLAVRLKFANPQDLLRPGMNVRVRVVLDEIPDALLVPQRAVTELLGKQFVSVIGADNKAEQRLVTLGDRIGELWVVKSGLKPGERIVVEGMQKAPPGTIVAPTMITEAQLDQASTPVVASPPSSPAASPKAATAPPSPQAVSPGAPAPAPAAPKSPAQ